MYLYLIFILLLAGSFLEIFDSKRQGTAQIIYYLTLSILFLLSFLRWERGTDWSGYYDYFSNIYDLDFSNNFEKLVKVQWQLVRMVQIVLLGYQTK